MQGNSTLKQLNRQTAHLTNTYAEKIVQFGGGNFLRAFVDWMIEELNRQAGFSGSVVIVKPTSEGSYERFNLQNGLFHVRLHGLNNGQLVTDCQLVSCVSRAINPYEDFQSFLDLARQPEIRFIVSNTTESGLTFAPDDKLTDAPPSSFPAKLTVFLYRRFQHFQGDFGRGCIVLPCELAEGNGDLLKQLVLQYAALWELEPEFAGWINASSDFCNTLVDRIVPGFPKTNAEAVLEAIGYDDQLLVEGEQYHSWIIQAPESLNDELPFSRTNLNVRLVDDVAPYREVKVRILNGAHTAMTSLGYLLGLQTVRQAVDHEQLGQFIHDLIYTEIIPALNPDDPELKQFADAVLNRFRNPFIHHLLLSIALNSISKFRVRLLPSLLDFKAKYGEIPPRIAFAFASLIRFYKGEWQGQAIPLNDDLAIISWFREQWTLETDVHRLTENVLSNSQLWGRDLSHVDGLLQTVSNYLSEIDSNGVLVALERQEWSIAYGD